MSIIDWFRPKPPTPTYADMYKARLDSLSHLIVLLRAFKLEKGYVDASLMLGYMRGIKWRTYRSRMLESRTDIKT